MNKWRAASGESERDIKQGHGGLQAVDFVGSRIVNSLVGMEDFSTFSIDLVLAGALVLALLAAGR
jgi:hypothetical protein